MWVEDPEILPQGIYPRENRNAIWQLKMNEPQLYTVMQNRLK